MGSFSFLVALLAVAGARCAAPLRNFQVSQPPVVPPTNHCDFELVHHNFANSYGQPAIVDYSPPAGCGKFGTWSSIVLNITGTSNGTQYDRLGTVFLSGVEIFRTSTPEPTPTGIIWTQLKDVSRYAPLFAKPGQLTLDIGNLLSDGRLGEYDVVLTAYFYASTSKYPAASTADLIIPISASSSDSSGRQFSTFFTVTNSYGVVNTTFPNNVAAAFVEVYASGNSNEEFWYGNIPDQLYSQLPTWSAPDGYALGKGPFREVQLLIDGTLAGVVFPYPVVYTGEFLPSLWRPMLSYGAGDSPTYYIDITPFLGLLTDDKPHSLSVGVAGMGLDPPHSINDNWYVSANIQILIGNGKTTGGITKYVGRPYVDPSVSGKVSNVKGNLTVTTNAARELSIEGWVRNGQGVINNVQWKQNLKFTNTETYTTITGRNFSTQLVTQKSSGVSTSFHSLKPVISDTFSYPFSLSLDYTTYTTSATQTTPFYDYNVTLQHEFNRQVSAKTSATGLGNSIATTQKTTGSQSQHQPNITLRVGYASEQFAYVDAALNTYTRDVGTTTRQNSTVGLTSVTATNVLWDRIGGNLAKGSY